MKTTKSKPHPPKTALEKDMVALMKKRGLVKLAAQKGKGKDAWLAARIPDNIAQDWLTRFGINAWKGEHWPAVKKLLQDPEWKHLRPTSFKL